MAQSIVRLKVESSEYDQKLKRASQMILNLGDNAKKTGQSLKDTDKNTVDFVRAIGQMETKATSAKGKVGELTQAFTDLSMQYKQMTEEEKRSPFGQAMSQSLEQLKGRIQEGRQSLSEINAEIGNTGKESSSTGGILEQLAGKFGLNITKLGAMGVALGATSAALKVAKDAFFSSESNVDEWGRTVESANSLYTAFCASLNGTNFSGFISHINAVISKAREAYDAMDNLNTMMTIINPERVKLQTRQQQLQTIIRREGKDSAAGRQAQVDLKALEPKLQQSFRTEAGLNWKAFETQVDKRLTEYGIKLDQRSHDILMKSFHDTGTFNQLRAGARGSRQYVGGQTIGTTSYGAAVSAGRWVDTRNTNQKLMDAFTDEWRSQFSPLLSASFRAIGQSYGTLKQDARYLGGGGGGGARGGGGGGGRVGGGTTTPTYVPVEGSIDKQQALVAALQKQWKAAADDESRAQIKAQIEAANEELDRMQGKVAAPVGSLKYYNEELKKLQEEQQLVTNNNDWEYYQGQIDVVTKKMKQLRGEVEQMATGQAGATGDAIGGWISAQQKSLGGMEIGSAEARNTYANIIDAKMLENTLNYALENDITISPDTIEALWEQIIGGDNIPDDVWSELEETINAALEELGLEPIKLNVDTGGIEAGAKEVKEDWKDAARAVQSVGNALQQIEDPGAKVAGLIGEAIANIALGFSQATASDSKLGVFGWIAAIAGGMATMLSTISAIKSATAGSYAEGGIIPGNNYNDGLVANVSSGELILNRAQQNSIAGQLQNSGIGNMQLEAVIAGEDIRLAVRNANRRRGRGEYVTSKR